MGKASIRKCAALEGFQLTGIPNSTSTSGITYTTALSLATRFAKLIRSEIDQIAEIYLFGSLARNESGTGNDVDIAVISKQFGADVTGDFGRINTLAFEVSPSIEAHPIVYEDWVHLTPFTSEIKKDGIPL